MKIGLQTWGSNGDILPFMGLAGALSDAGHEVTVAYTSVDNRDYSHLEKDLNIRTIRAFYGFPPDAGNICGLTKSKRPLKEFILLLQKFYDPATQDMYNASETLCKENDLVIGHVVTHTLLTASEKYKCPRATIALCPSAVRSKHISPFGKNLGSILNLFLWNIGDMIWKWRCFGPANKIRLQQGLAPINSLQKDLFISKELTIISTTKVICNRQADWGNNIQICGVLGVPEDNSNWQIPEGLPAFLNAGEPPVYLFFGSCAQFDLKNTTRLLIDAVKLSGKRAIIQSDWKQLSFDEDHPNIYKVNAIPHAEIFPRCSVIVHHGGAGTTHASLLAGKPSIVVEHAYDQSYWGQQLQRIGVAGELLDKRSVTPQKLASAIRTISESSEMRDKAMELKEIIENENGLSKAVEIIEERFG